MNTAIIVAAGSGQRFGSETPKQFLKLKGKTVLEWAIERFENAGSVDSIVLVLAEGQMEKFRSAAERYPKLLHIVSGGATRSTSVLNGLLAVPEGCEVVAVHDGARPLVSAQEIDRTIGQALRTGAACLVGPVTDTIKSIRQAEIAGTLDREKLRRALTPQAFRKGVLKQAFDLAGEAASQATDECYLVEKLGHPIALVEGSARNIKITHPEDLALAAAIMDSELSS
jgi:2-C-methyl-D-erythritol 4-phosphate cytidylyltransferase